MKILALFLFVFIPQHAHANLWGGRIYQDQYISTVNGVDRNRQSSTSAWLDFDDRPSDQGLGAHAILQLDAVYKNIDSSMASHAYFRARELYVSYLSPGIDLKIGQQIIPWGKSDGVNPTDYFTGKDLSILNPDEEVKRRGAPSVNFTYTLDEGKSPLSLNFIFQTTDTPMRLLIPTQSVPSGLALERYPHSPEVFDPHSFEFGFKISYQKSNYDFSVSAFSGVAQYPEYLLDKNTLTIRPFNPHEKALGGDGSFTWGNTVVRLESALHLPENGASDDPAAGLVEPYHWDSVVGIERPINDDFRFQIQGLYRYHFSYANQPKVIDANPIYAQINSGLATANALILNYQNQGNPGATVRLSYASDHSSYTGDLFLLGYFGGGQSYLFRPQVGYTPFENFKLQSGLDLYGGNTNRPLGALHNQSDWFFEVKSLF